MTAATPDETGVALPTIPANTLTETEVDGYDHREIHNLIAAYLNALRTTLLGQPAAATDQLGYVRLHDGTSKGLWVPVASLMPGLIINGNYDHWQEVEGGNQTCTTTFNARTSFGPDRMFTLPAGASVTVGRSTTVPDNKSRFSAAITGAASVTTVDHGQRIRSAYRTGYKQSLLFAAYVRNESGAAYTPTLRVDTPAAADDWTTPANRLSQSLQQCADSAWTLVYHVFDPSTYTNIDNGLSVNLRIPSGSSVNGDVNRIAQFRLQPATQLMTYVPPDPDAEMVRCISYRKKSYSVGVAPATDTLVGLQGGGFFASGGTNAELPVAFGVPMWKIPSISLYGKAGAANKFFNGTTDVDASTAGKISSGGFSLGNSTTGAELVFAHYVAVAELT